MTRVPASLMDKPRQGFGPTRLMRPRPLKHPGRRRPPVPFAEPAPVVERLPDEGRPARVGLDLRTFGRHEGGGRKIGWRPVQIDYGAAGFRAHPEEITPRGWAPNRYPPGHANLHLLDVILRNPKPDKASGDHVTNQSTPPSTMLGTVLAIAHRIILQEPGYDDVTPAGFRASGVDRRKNPPPAGLFGVIPSVIYKFWSFRDAYGVPFAHGNEVWHRRDPAGSMTSTSGLKNRYRQQPAHRPALTLRNAPGVNPAVTIPETPIMAGSPGPGAMRPDRRR